MNKPDNENLENRDMDNEEQSAGKGPPDQAVSEVSVSPSIISVISKKRAKTPPSVLTAEEGDEVGHSSWPLAAISTNGEAKPIPAGNKKVGSETEETDSSGVDLDLSRFLSRQQESVTQHVRSPRRPRRASRQREEPCMAEYVPPDGGWGWLCVAGAFVNYFLVVGLTRSFGAVYDELREAFPDSTHTQIATIPSIISTLIIGLTILAGGLSKKFSCRAVGFAGGFLCSSSVCLCFLATSLTALTVCFTFAGIGAALTTTPGILTIAMYFRKKRALATGLCLSGSAIGSMVQPPLLQFLTRKFGFRGALLILGIAMYTTCAAALTFRDPVSAYFSRAERSAEADTSSAPAIPDDGRETSTSMHSVKGTIFMDQEMPGPSVDIIEIAGPDEGGSTSSDSDLRAMDYIAYDLEFVADVGTDRIDTALVGHADNAEGPEEPLPPIQVTEVLSVDDERSPLHAVSIAPSSSLLDVAASPRDNVSQIVRRPIVASVSSASVHLNYVSTNELKAEKIRRHRSSSEILSSTGSMLLLHFQTHAEARYDIYEHSSKNKCFLWIKRYLYVDMDYLKNSVFIIVFISSTMMIAVYPTGLIFIPPFSISQGVEKTMAGVLLSVAAAGDLAGRLLCGWILDKNFFSKQYAFMSGLVILGTSYMLLASSNIYWLMATCACVYGLSGGVSILTLPVLLADHHGANNLSSTYGLARLGQVVVGLATPPIAGFLRDETGVFLYSFIFMGSLSLLGGAIALGIPIVKNKYRKKVTMWVEKRRLYYEGSQSQIF